MNWSSLEQFMMETKMLSFLRSIDLSLPQKEQYARYRDTKSLALTQVESMKIVF